MCTICTAHARDLSVGQSVSHFSELQNTNNNKLHHDKMKSFPLIYVAILVKHNQLSIICRSIINHYVHGARRNELCNLHIQSLKSRIKQFRDEGTFCDTVLNLKMGHSSGFIGLCYSIGVSGGRLAWMRNTQRLETFTFCCRMLKLKM